MFIGIGIVYAKSDTLEYLKDIDGINVPISNLMYSNHKYLFSEVTEDTDLYVFNNEKMVATKKIENLRKTKIIKYKDNYLVIGVQNNTLKGYLIDENLKILKQVETSYFISNHSKINLYKYNDKVYVMLTYEEILSNSSIYEIDSDFKVKENKLSTYSADTLKSILKSDYYLIHNNDKEEGTSVIRYSDSTDIDGIYVLVGNESFLSEEEPLKKAVITFYDGNGNVIREDISSQYKEYTEAYVVNDKIIVLGKTVYEENKILVFSEKGEILEEISLSSNEEEVHLSKVSNQLIVHLSNRIMVYGYTVNLYKEESKFGTIEVNDKVVPYDTVQFAILPNSGYEVDTVVVKDRQGNVIEVNKNTFVMPENDVTIQVEYKESVINPETIDFIGLAVVILLIVSLISIYLYRKMVWLR